METSSSPTKTEQEREQQPGFLDDQEVKGRAAGATTGAVAGAVVAGPVGAVAGGLVGQSVGALIGAEAGSEAGTVEVVKDPGTEAAELFGGVQEQKQSS
jgi:outer membrane lipoprotein SlyB